MEKNKNSRTLKRKDDHIRINVEEDVQSGLTTGLEKYSLQHCALPEINLSDVSPNTSFLGYEVKLPLLISSMTGGTHESEKINIHLAQAAQATGIAMGLGSQRAAAEDPIIAETFNLRKYAPEIPVFANLGAIQLNYGFGLDECRKVIDSAQANGLILHLNPLQEALQPEGDTNFANLLAKIAQICNSLDCPVIVKEVGWGISEKVAIALKDAGVAAIDVAGAGGTSWSQVEMYRNSDERIARVASHFWDWGIPTADAIYQVKRLNLGLPLIASGGLKNGIDIAKSIALGADLCGMAGRLIKAAVKSAEEVVAIFEEIHLELRIAMFACGAKNIETLKTIQIIHRQENNHGR